MDTMTEQTFIQKVAQAQSEINVAKSSNRDVSYDSRSAEQIQAEAKPILAKHGLVISVDQKIGFYGERYFIESRATIVGENGETVSGSGVAELLTPPQNQSGKFVMNEAQASGATGSYADKIALENVLGIGAGEDADHSKYQPGENTTYTKKLSGNVTEKQVALIEVKVKALKSGSVNAHEAFGKWYKTTFANKPFPALTKAEGAKVIDKLLGNDKTEDSVPADFDGDDLAEFSGEVF